MRGRAGKSCALQSVSRWARASVVPCTGWGRFPSRGRGRAAGSRSCSRRGRRRWRACQKNQETPPRHPAHHRTWLLQRQARGVQQQDQGHHPHGLRLPPRHQPHRPDHAPMQRTRHPTTTTHNLTHKNSRSLKDRYSCRAFWVIPRDNPKSPARIPIFEASAVFVG